MLFGTEFLKRYKDELPGVAATLTTALIIFLASLSFRPVRHLLFEERVTDYPLLCIFEPAIDDSKKNLIVEVFFINRTGDDYTEENLQSKLKQAAADTGSTFAPAIELQYSMPTGEVGSAKDDEVFNGVRGVLEVKVINPKTVRFSVKSIAKYSILRGEIIVIGREDLLASVSKENMRAVPLPFKVSNYQDGPCYGR